MTILSTIKSWESFELLSGRGQVIMHKSMNGIIISQSFWFDCHSLSAGLFYCMYISCLQPETSRILCIYHPTECPSCSCWHHDVTTTVQVRNWLTRPRSGSGDNHGVMSGELMHKFLFCQENIHVINLGKMSWNRTSHESFQCAFFSSSYILVILLKVQPAPAPAI